MKKILLTALLCASAYTFAQYTLPAASPRAKVEQQFSLSKITVDYGRPAVKGREIFGALVPYGKVWRAGANSSTKITFSQGVLLQGKNVPSGTYGLFVEPSASKWRVILSSDSQSWGTQYDASKDVLSVEVPVEKLPTSKEYFEISIQPVSEHKAHIVMEWDRTAVRIPVEAAGTEKLGRIQEKLMEIRGIEREK